MLQDVMAYLEYLETVCGLSVSVHTATSGADTVIDSMAPYNIHRSEFCLSVKEDLARHRRCLAHQKQVRAACHGKHICVTCPFGVKEQIFPIWKDILLCGYLAVSTDQPLQTVQTLLRPLVVMLTLVLDPTKNGESSDLYEHILAVIHGNLDKKLTIDLIAERCFCSASQVCHLFKQRSGTTVNRYITEQKMKKALQLLQSGNSISETAAACGFADTNYFISVFKHHYGHPPLRYIKSI